MPSRRDMDPLGIEPRLLPWIIILDVEEAPRRFRYRLIGTRLVEVMDRDVTGHYLDDLRELLPAVDTTIARCNAVVDSCWPLNFEDDLIDVIGTRVWAERLALPLGETDTRVEAIMVGFAAQDHPPGPDEPEAA